MTNLSESVFLISLTRRVYTYRTFTG